MECKRSIQTEIRVSADGKYIEGIASRFGSYYHVPQEDCYETVKPYAFQRSLASGRDITVNYDHDKHSVLGSTELGTAKVWVDEEGLKYRVKFDAEDPDHQRVRAKINSGLIKGSSFVFHPIKRRYSRSQQGVLQTIEEAELLDLGPVILPCDPTSVAYVRSINTDPEYLLWLESEKRIRKFKESCNI